MSLYSEVKKLIELGHIGSVLSTLHTARASSSEEDLEEFYSVSARLLSEALAKNAWRRKQYVDRLIDKAYRTIDRGGVKIVGGKPGLASRHRFERLLKVLEKHENGCPERALKAIVRYALYPKYRRVPTMSCSVIKYDGIIKLVQCFTSGRRCLEAFKKLKEYKTIFTLRASLRAAYSERNLEAAKKALELLYLGTPADKAEAYLIMADLVGGERKERASKALEELEEYCEGDYCGKIDRAIDYSRTCTRIPRLREYAESVLREVFEELNRPKGERLMDSGKPIKTRAGKAYIIKAVSPIPTGIPELDALTVRGNKELKPGVDVPGIYLIAGGPGTGKTLMALTLAQKACDNGALVIYFTIEETTSELLRAASLIGLDLEKHLKDSRFIVVEYAPKKGMSDESPYTFSPESLEEKDLESTIVEIVDSAISDAGEFSYLVLIVDSLPALTSLDKRINKRDFLRVIKSITNLTYSLARIIGEEDFTVEQYVAKGFIELHSLRTLEGIYRYLIIPKMRARPHYTGVVPFDITGEGIKIYLPGTEEYFKRIEVIKKSF